MYLSDVKKIVSDEKTSHVQCLIESNSHKEPMTLFVLPQKRSCAAGAVVNGKVEDCINKSKHPPKDEHWDTVNDNMHK